MRWILVILEWLWGAWSVCLVAGVLIAGAAIRLRRCYTGSSGPTSAPVNSSSSELKRRLLILVVLASASSPAIIMTIGTPRYFLPVTPFFYLAIASCAEIVLQCAKPSRHGLLLLLFYIVACASLCFPNFIVPRPNQRFDALRHIAPLVRQTPVIAADWAEPDAILAFCGSAKSINSWDGIHQADIKSGAIDVLLIDQGFRATKTWADQRGFFEDFERRPEHYGFRKQLDHPTQHFDLYYRPEAGGASDR
jgi:hypothetical protein